MNTQVRNNLKPQAQNVAPTTVTVRPRFNPPKCDPVTQAERDMTALNPDIDNTGGALYNNEAFCIVHRYETEQEEQIRENEECGIGDVTNAEAYIIQECSFYELYDDNDWVLDEEEVFEYDEETYSFYGTYSDDYITSVMSGEIIDEDNMCKMGTPDIGSSVPAEAIQDNTDVTIAPDSALATDATPKLDAATTDANDLEAIDGNAPPIASVQSEPALIETDVDLTNQFTNASTHTPKPEPTIAPTPTEPANASAYQMSA